MQMKQLSKSGVEIVGNLLRDESLKLFSGWSSPHRLGALNNSCGVGDNLDLGAA